MPSNKPIFRSTSAPTAAAAIPAPNARSTSNESGVPSARADCLAQRGHFCPTTVLTMQRVQIGSPQLEQVSRVSVSGWLTHAGTTCAESVAIAISIYEGSSITARPSLRPLTRSQPAAWNMDSPDTVAGEALPGTPGTQLIELEEAPRADGHVCNQRPSPDRRF